MELVLGLFWIITRLLWGSYDSLWDPMGLLVVLPWFAQVKIPNAPRQVC